MSERPVLICGLATPGHPAVPGTTQGWCELCAAEVLIAPSSRFIPDPLMVCLECYPGLRETLGPAEVMRPTEEQRAELHNIGVTDAEIDRAWEHANREGS